ncbi:hypothetical protein ACFL08_05450 [Patescibacteria group bacterium]
MMSDKGLVMTVDADGKMQMEMIGYSGNECLLDAGEIAEDMKLLGVEIGIDDIKMKKNTEVSSVNSVCSTQEVRHNE